MASKLGAQWVRVEDALPMERPEDYEVMAATTKLIFAPPFEKTYKRVFARASDVRRRPQNYTAWSYDQIGHVNHTGEKS